MQLKTVGGGLVGGLVFVPGGSATPGLPKYEEIGRTLTLLITYLNRLKCQGRVAGAVSITQTTLQSWPKICPILKFHWPTSGLQ